MSTDRVLERRKPSTHQLFTCYLLVGKVMVDGSADFDRNEINFAKDVVEAVKWNQNVQDFLDVIAGSRPHEHDTLYPLCLAALRFNYPINEGAP